MRSSRRVHRYLLDAGPNVALKTVYSCACTLLPNLKQSWNQQNSSLMKPDEANGVAAALIDIPGACSSIPWAPRTVACPAKTPAVQILSHSSTSILFSHDHVC